MKKWILFILFIILIFFIFYYSSYKKKEGFINIERVSIFNPNYCESVDGKFIEVTDPNDSRCLINQTKNRSINSDKMNPWGYRSCITGDNTQYGVYNMEKCYSVIPKPVPTSSSFSFQDSLSDLSGLGLDGDLTGLSDLSNLSGLSGLEKPYKKTCEELKLPNSSPCIPIENFTNQNEADCVTNFISDENTKDLNKYCQCLMKTKGRSDYMDFGASDVEVIDNNAVVNCKKYYYTTSTQLTVDNKGVYDPSYFAPYKYIPRRIENGIDKPNMTGCYDNDLDFNNLCSSMNQNQLWGSFKKLNGEDGGCYYQNGMVNTNQSNSICSVNYNNELQKLNFPPSQNPDRIPLPNLYTKCKTLSTNTDMTTVQTTMNAECNNMRSINKTLTAYGIDSYDCPPGQFRAKCK